LQETRRRKLSAENQARKKSTSSFGSTSSFAPQATTCGAFSLTPKTESETQSASPAPSPAGGTHSALQEIRMHPFAATAPILIVIAIIAILIA
jgi:hypothetical protein